jgi:hypothetical protein
MSNHQPRIPASCPNGFRGRYTVSQGDTMFELHRCLEQDLRLLQLINPHIPDPNFLLPGDILCVPSINYYTL